MKKCYYYIILEENFEFINFTKKHKIFKSIKEQCEINCQNEFDKSSLYNMLIKCNWGSAYVKQQYKYVFNEGSPIQDVKIFKVKLLY
jgi:hypothetical protein